MEFHEAANLFPLMNLDDFNALVEDLRGPHGMRESIKLLGGKVLDGRNRYRACEKAGIPPRYEELPPGTDPIAYVLSLNLHRRHLTEGQKAMIGARVRKIYDRQARERMSAGGGDRKSKTAKSGQELVPDPIQGQSRDLVGEAVGVCGRSIDYATRVLSHAIPEIIEAVDEGYMGIKPAAALSVETEEVQRQAAQDAKKRPGRKPRPRASTETATPRPEPEQQPAGANGEIKSRGVGVRYAHEAINSLIRIPKNDALRERGFQIVKDWIRRNK